MLPRMNQGQEATAKTEDTMTPAPQEILNLSMKMSELGMMFRIRFVENWASRTNIRRVTITAGWGDSFINRGDGIPFAYSGAGNQSEEDHEKPGRYDSNQMTPPNGGLSILGISRHVSDVEHHGRHGADARRHADPERRSPCTFDSPGLLDGEAVAIQDIDQHPRHDHENDHGAHDGEPSERLEPFVGQVGLYDLKDDEVDEADVGCRESGQRQNDPVEGECGNPATHAVPHDGGHDSEKLDDRCTAQAEARAALDGEWNPMFQTRLSVEGEHDGDDDAGEYYDYQALEEVELADGRKKSLAEYENLYCDQRSPPHQRIRNETEDSEVGGRGH